MHGWDLFDWPQGLIGSSTADLPEIATFRDWLLAEAAAGLRRLC
jgi:hypothetical protein